MRGRAECGEKTDAMSYGDVLVPVWVLEEAALAAPPGLTAFEFVAELVTMARSVASDVRISSASRLA